MTAAVARLAFAGIARRKLEAALTLLIAGVAAATLTIALSVRAIADEPWERTFEATRGPDVVAASFDDDLTPLLRETGVADAAGPLPIALTSLRYGGRRYGVVLQARPQAPMRIEQPLVTDGKWLRPGTVVLERSYARALGVRPGERVTVAGASGPVELVVAGVAVTTTQQRYPESQPGLAWVLPATLDEVQPAPERRTSVLFLRLAQPHSAKEFVERLRSDDGLAGRSVFESWPELRAEALDDTRVNQVIFGTFSALIALAIGFALATTVGGRVLAESRTLGVLKATGFTPPQVAAVVLAENAMVGAVGAVVGTLAGAALSPAFVATSVELVGGTPEPSFAPLQLALSTLAVLAVLVVFSFLPAWSRAKRTTAAVLAPPRGAARSRLQAVAARFGLPPVALIGVKDTFARPGRAVLTALTLSLAIAAVVAALSMEATFAAASEPPAATRGVPSLTDAAGEALPPDPVRVSADEDRLRPLVYGLNAILLAIALVALVTTTLLGVRERAREFGVLKAVGFTPRQLLVAVMANQLVLTIVALLVGIPLGLLVFRVAYEAAGGRSDEIGSPAHWQLLVLGPVAMAVFAALSAAAARRLTVAPVVAALRHE
jgi:putative ABC transport system permease protein